jgi:hypothetical protein
MSWFWLNMPLAAVFFGAWYGIPMWLVFKRPGWGSAPPAVTAPAPRRQAGPAELQTAAVSSRSGQLADVP